MRIVEGGIALKESLKKYLKENFSPGEIDVNIMTKVDKDNYENNVQLPVEFNDAHAALRGFVQSNLSSFVVLSAGMNPRLYSYFEHSFLLDYQ
jgi:2-hydroxy-3-keto-5-methylthiopentenyl-1-phosphate phosphatase